MKDKLFIKSLFAHSFYLDDECSVINKNISLFNGIKVCFSKQKIHLYINSDNDDNLILSFYDVNGEDLFKKFDEIIIPFDTLYEKMKNCYIRKHKTHLNPYIFISFDIPYTILKTDCYFDSEDKKYAIFTISFFSLSVKNAIRRYDENNKSDNYCYDDNQNNFNLIPKLEFGKSKDANICSTILGIAVKNKNTDDWYIFDKNDNKIVNISNFAKSTFPIFLLPVKTLSVGDLIKRNGGYYYLLKITDIGTYKFLDVSNGEIIETIKEEYIIKDITFFTKVIALDINTLLDYSSKCDMSNNILAAVAIMSCLNKKSDEDLAYFLPLIMSKSSTDKSLLPFITMLINKQKIEDTSKALLFISTLLSQKNKICPNCNSYIDEDAKFCYSCGNTLI